MLGFWRHDGNPVIGLVVVALQLSPNCLGEKGSNLLPNEMGAAFCNLDEKIKTRVTGALMIEWI